MHSLQSYRAVYTQRQENQRCRSQKRWRWRYVQTSLKRTFLFCRFFSIDDINHQGARRIARIAKEAGVQKFVHLSHVLAQPNPPGVYIKGGSEFVKTKVQSLHPPSVCIKGGSEFVKTKVQSLHPPSVCIKGGSEFVKTKVKSLHPPGVYIKGGSEFVKTTGTILSPSQLLHQGKLRVC